MYKNDVRYKKKKEIQQVLMSTQKVARPPGVPHVPADVWALALANRHLHTQLIFAKQGLWFRSWLSLLSVLAHVKLLPFLMISWYRVRCI